MGKKIGMALPDQQGSGGQTAQTGPAGNQQPSEQEGAVSLPVEQVTGQDEAAVANGQPQTEQLDPYEFRDLIAQEIMAEAAVWMAVAAFLTFAVTSFGTLLIWRQVRLTREAVEDTSEATEAMREANRIAEAAQRAWLTPGNPKVMVGTRVTIEGKLHESTWGFIMVWENSGKSPAFSVMSNVAIKVMNPEDIGEPAFDDDVSEPDNKGAICGPGAERLTPTAWLIDDQFEKFTAGKLRVFIYSRAHYHSDARQIEWRKSQASYEVIWTGTDPLFRAAGNFIAT